MDFDPWGEEPDWGTEEFSHTNDLEENAMFGAQHILILIDSTKQMYVPSIPFQGMNITPMHAAMKACESILRQKIRHVATNKTGKRDGIGILFHGSKVSTAEESDDDDDNNKNSNNDDVIESDLEDSEIENPPTNAPVKWILSLAPPGIQQVKTIQSCLDNSTSGRNLHQECCPDEEFDSSRPLRTALQEASKTFATAKCVKRRARSDKAPPDAKSIWIFTCRDTPCRNLTEDRQHFITTCRDVHENGIDILVWPFSIDFDSTLFYKDIISTPPPDDFTWVDFLYDMQHHWNQTRILFSVPLIFPNSEPCQPGIMMDFFRTVVPQRRPMPVWITQTTKKMTEKITQTIVKETGDILRITGNNAPSNPLSMDPFLTYTEFGGERIPLTSMDVVKIKMASNFHHEIAGVALIGFRPASAISLTHFLEKSYFCYPNDNIVKGSTQAFANLHASMKRKQVVLIGELLTRVTASSRLVALIPQVESKDIEGVHQVLAPGMIVVPLPYEDDVRTMDDDAGNTASRELVEEAKGLLRSQKLAHLEFGNTFENAHLKRFWTYIESVALGTACPVKESCDTEIDEESLRELLGKKIGNFLRELPIDKEEEKFNGGPQKRKPLSLDMSGCDWVNLYTTNSLSVCKVDELKQYLRAIGARISGKKEELVLRVSQSIGNRIVTGED